MRSMGRREQGNSARPLPVMEGVPLSVTSRELDFPMPADASGVKITVRRYGDPIDPRAAAAFGRTVIRNVDEAAEMLERQGIETFLKDQFLPDTVVRIDISVTRVIGDE
ncbi:hypothetical protein [Oceanicaulis sp.]|uniref:hypothetical protein n=1 Tax=Oceanicaulis sp. TaxID=1924941 RepID=UPI003D284947